MKKVKSLFFALLMGAVTTLGSQMVFAAEDAAGVAKHLEMALQASEAALVEAKGGNAEKMDDLVMEAKQHTKEITGDTVGPVIQRVNGNYNKARSAAKKGKVADAVAPLEQAIEQLKSL